MPLDNDLEKDILAELAAEPALQGREISVTVEKGIVIMRGSVVNHAEKRLADQAARRVGGRNSLALGVSIRLRPLSNEEWAKNVRSSLEHDQNNIPRPSSPDPRRHR